MIRFENVSFGYSGESSILRDTSFTIQKGQITALIGANGAGKSTLARLMRGLIRPDSGRILLNGEDMRKIPASTLAARMGYLFQNPDRQICRNTVREELMFTLEHTGAQDAEKLCEEALQALDLHPEDEPFLLSRGERQRVALASALVHRPELLILDEPTTGLDYKECMQIMEFVKRLNEDGVTVVMVCHDMEIVLDYADQVIVMSQGHVVDAGPTREIFRKKEVLAEAALLSPQIIQLSMMLGDPFGAVCTVDEMADGIEKAVRA